MPSRVTTRLLLAGLLHLCCVASPCAAQDDKAIAWLFRNQLADGSWPAEASGPPDLRSTALCVLAVLGNGHGTHLRSHNGDPHREPFRRAVDWLRAQQDEHGRIAHRKDAGPDWVFDHALATLALCEAARLSTEPYGSEHGVHAFGHLTSALQAPGASSAESLAIAALCIASTRRFDARMTRLAEQYPGWRETLDEQPPWSKGAARLEAQLQRARQAAAVRTPRQHAAMLVVEAHQGVTAASLLAAPLQAFGLDAIARDHLAMLLFALAAKAHLRSSSGPFEDAWWQFEKRAEDRMRELRAVAGEAAGSWNPSTAAVASRIRLTATFALLSHQFPECRKRAPRAWTRTLQEALAGADGLVVRRDRSSNDKAPPQAPPPLLELADAKAITSLVRQIEIDGARSNGTYCMCAGSPFLEFYAGNRLITILGMHHGGSLRWHDGPWRGDGILKLKSARLLNSWLAERGVAGPQREVEEARERDRRDQLDIARWRAAMPASLQPMWPRMRSGQVSQQLLDEMRTALGREQPDATQRIRMLLAWFGSGSGAWGTYPSYESLAQTLLLEFKTQRLIAAMAASKLSERQLEGAARLFAGWEFSSTRGAERQQLSAEWNRKLLRQGLRNADPDRAERARHAFEK